MTHQIFQSSTPLINSKIPAPVQGMSDDEKSEFRKFFKRKGPMIKTNDSLRRIGSYNL